MEEAGLIAMSAEQLCIIGHKNGPRTKWLLYPEGGCEKNGTPFEVVGNGDCSNTCPCASRPPGSVAPRFPGLEIKEVRSCGGLVFVEGVKSIGNEEGSMAVAEV